jgi:hypothetical protein
MGRSDPSARSLPGGATRPTIRAVILDLDDTLFDHTAAVTDDVGSEP